MSPVDICSSLITAKYTLMVAYAMLDYAKRVTKSTKVALVNDKRQHLTDL